MDERTRITTQITFFYIHHMKSMKQKMLDKIELILRLVSRGLS